MRIKKSAGRREIEPLEFTFYCPNRVFGTTGRARYFKPVGISNIAFITYYNKSCGDFLTDLPGNFGVPLPGFRSGLIAPERC